MWCVFCRCCMPDDALAGSRCHCAWMHACAGQAAGRALEERIGRRPVSCEVQGRDMYGRDVAKCSIAGRGDIGQWLVANGQAVAYRWGLCTMSSGALVICSCSKGNPPIAGSTPGSMWVRRRARAQRAGACGRAPLRCLQTGGGSTRRRGGPWRQVLGCFFLGLGVRYRQGESLCLCAGEQAALQDVRQQAGQENPPSKARLWIKRLASPGAAAAELKR